MVTTLLLHLYFAQNLGQVLAIGDRIRMLRSKHVLTDAQCPPAQMLGLCKATLRNVEFGQIVEPFSG